MLERLPAYLAALDRGLAILAAREAASPELATRCPSRLLLTSAEVAPAAFFGPGVSPWTGEEEFARGVDLAAPLGAAVLAPGNGTVLFAGRLPRLSGRRLWQLGNLAVLSHGPAGATLYGHLSRVDVRRGDRVRRGRRIGTVGRSGWALSPRLHYELWRGERGRLRPTDPLFSMLDRPFDSPALSLQKMLTTSAPGPLEPLPGAASR